MKTIYFKKICRELVSSKHLVPFIMACNCLIMISAIVYYYNYSLGTKHIESMYFSLNIEEIYNVREYIPGKEMNKLIPQTKGSEKEFRYIHPVIKLGKPLSIPTEVLNSMGFPLTNFINLKEHTSQSTEADEFIFITGSDEKFSKKLRNLIDNLQRFFPRKKIIVYDMGMKSATLEKISKYCGVKEIKEFYFNRYPKHVRHFYNYAFKPIIIHEALREFPAIFWVDSAIRFNSSQLNIDIHKTNGIMTFSSTGHSNFVATHPDLYEYLPTVPAKMRVMQMREAGIILIHRTEDIYKKVIAFWVLCALEQKCIQPIRELTCERKGDWYFGNCHRFDQSIVNVLLANHFKFNNTVYFTDRQYVVAPQRGDYSKQSPMVCA